MIVLPLIVIVPVPVFVSVTVKVPEVVVSNWLPNASDVTLNGFAPAVIVWFTEADVLPLKLVSPG